MIIPLFATRAHWLLMATWGPPGYHNHHPMPLPYLLVQTTLQPVHTQPVLGHQVIPPQAQDCMFPVVELDNIPLHPFLQLIKAPLEDCTTISLVSHPSLELSTKLAEGALCPIIQLSSDDIKLYWTQHRPLEDTARDWTLPLITAQQFSQLSVPLHCTFT